MSTTIADATFGANRVRAAPPGSAAMTATTPTSSSAAGRAHTRAARRRPAYASPSPGHTKLKLVALIGLGGSAERLVRERVVVPASGHGDADEVRVVTSAESTYAGGDSRHLWYQSPLTLFVKRVSIRPCDLP